ncbi:MAG: diacylglycerol kinase family lipid kinase [Chloroflexi bacterium]|nr:MAG: diacylglycerol kinase family lipid kinase [Chloroflexota bacterium]
MNRLPLPTPSDESRVQVFLVINPISGIVDESTRLSHYLKFFQLHNWTCQVYHTSEDERTIDAVRQAVQNGADLVVVSGGDGTISEAATALCDTEVPLGILPAGTGNIMARDLGIPINTDRALDLLVNEHRICSMDLMKVGERCYALNVSIGFSAATMGTIGREQKKRFGFFAYLINVVINLTGVRLHRLQVQVDDLVYRVRASEVMVGNTSLVGFRRMPRQLVILPDDGAVDVIISRALTLWDWIMVVVNFVLGIKSANPRFKTLNARKRILVQSMSPLTVQADGDVIGTTPVEVQVLPGAVRVIVPGTERNLVSALLRKAGLYRANRGVGA